MTQTHAFEFADQALSQLSYSPIQLSPMLQLYWSPMPNIVQTKTNINHGKK